MTTLSRLDHAPQLDAASEWQLERLTKPSRLFGANGIRTGADGRLYVAQVAGSQLSAADVDSGAIETISPMGGDIVAPDDLAFDEQGNAYVTEITEGRVSKRSPDGKVTVLQDDMPCANPVTVYQNRVIAGECRPGGRIFELGQGGTAPRLILDNVPMPNAFEVGPDGKLYFPVMGTNEIWRVDLKGGQPEVVATDLGVPDSVKFDAEGYIVSTQVASGQVLRINPQTGEKTVLATVAPGLDNCSFIDGRLFVSSISGQINEVLGNGELRSVIHDGLQWPLGVAVNEDAELFIADGGYTYTSVSGGSLQVAGMLFSPGFPGFTRGVCADGAGQWLVTTANGHVARFKPKAMESEFLAEGFDRLMGVAKTRKGGVVFAEYGVGKVHLLDGAEQRCLAEGLAQPTGVAVSHDDNIYVSETAGGRISCLRGGKAETFADDLQNPQGLAIHDAQLFVVDTGSRSVYSYDLNNGERQTIASGLPVGAPPGVTPKPLGPVGDMAGPMTSFCGLAVSNTGDIVVAGDAEGSVLKISRR